MEWDSNSTCNGSVTWTGRCPRSAGTPYAVRVMHAAQAGRDAHAAMGFEQGWGMALDQLVALMKAQP